MPAISIRQSSTHILELPNPDDKGLIENEAVMLSVAKTIGLPVVEHQVVQLGQTKLLLIARYDRSVEDDDVLRLHPQDLWQVTGLPPDIKSESVAGRAIRSGSDRKKNWVGLATDIGIGKSWVLRTVRELGDRIPDLLDLTRRGTAGTHGSTRRIPASPATRAYGPATGQEDPRTAGVNGICGIFVVSWI